MIKKDKKISSRKNNYLNSLRMFDRYFGGIIFRIFSKKTIRNSSWVFIGELSNSILGIVISMMIIKMIGNDANGIFVLSQSYMSIFDTLLNVQSWRSVIKYGQMALIGNDKNGFMSYAKAGFILDVATAFIGGIIAYMSVNILSSFMGWGLDLIICAKIFTITIFFHLSGTATAILMIFERYKIIMFQKIISACSAIFFVFLIIFLTGTTKLSLVVLAYCGANILSNLLLIFFAIREYRKKFSLRETINSKMPKKLKAFVNYALWATTGEAVDIPIAYFDVFIVSILGTETVSIFKVFKQIVGIINKTVSPIRQVIFPKFAKMIAENNHKEGYNMMLKVRNLLFPGFLLISFILGITSQYWLMIIFGKIYADNFLILLMYLLVQSFCSSYFALHPLFSLVRHPKESTIICLVANVVYVLVSYVLIGKLGLIAMVLSLLVQAIIVIYWKMMILRKEVCE